MIGATGPAGADGVPGPAGPAGPAGVDGGVGLTGQLGNSVNAFVKSDAVSATTAAAHANAVADFTFEDGEIILSHGGGVNTYDNVHSIVFTATSIGAAAADNLLPWLQVKTAGDYIKVSSEDNPGEDFGIYEIVSIGPSQAE